MCFSWWRALEQLWREQQASLGSKQHIWTALHPKRMEGEHKIFRRFHNSDSWNICWNYLLYLPITIAADSFMYKKNNKHIGATFHELLNVTFWCVIVSPSLTTNQAAVCLALQIQWTWKIPLIFKVCLFARWFFPPSLSNFENYNLSKTKNISVMDCWGITLPH